MDPIERLAEKLYMTYSQAVGGKAYDGNVLPNWIEFRNDPTKRKQSNAWIRVAHVAMTETTPPTQ